MKFSKLALATVAAFGLAGVAQADPTYYVEESLELWGTLGGDTLSTPQTGANVYGKKDSSGAFWFGDAADDTAILAYEDNAPSGSNKFPTKNGEATTVGSKYLKVSNSSTLWRMLQKYSWEEGQEPPTEFPVAEDGGVSVGEGLFVDTLVQFTPSEDAPTPEPGSKLIVWMNTNGVLCVTASKIKATYDEGADGYVPSYERFDFDTSKDGLVTNTWYRLTVKAYAEVLGDMGAGVRHGFKVYIDGAVVSSTAAAIDLDAEEAGDYVEADEDFEDDIKAGKMFLSLSAVEDAKLSAVGFKGEGLVDDLLVSDLDPISEEAPAGGIDFTLTWGEGVSAVWYAINGGDYKEAEKDATITLADGKTITITADPAAWYAIDESSIPAQADLEDGQTYEITASIADNAADAGVKNEAFADWTPAEVKAAFGDQVTPAALDAAAAPELDYQFGQVLNTLSTKPSLEIIGIAQNATNSTLWDITVQVVAGENALSIDDGFKSTMRASLQVIASDTIAGLASTDPAEYDLAFDETATDLTISVPAADGQFFKAAIVYTDAKPTVTPPVNQEPEEQSGNDNP